MRRTESRMIDPLKGHERLAQRAYGVKSPREIDEDVRAAFNETRVPAADRPRITGGLVDGMGLLALLDALERLGIITNEVSIDPVDVEPATGPPTVAALAAAGSTAAISVAGNDRDGAITLTPGGTGIAAGNIIDLTFAVARPNSSYSLILGLASGAARTLGMKVGRSARTSAKVTIATDTALTSGSTYVWDYAIRPYG